jgi:hypothetical protein
MSLKEKLEAKKLELQKRDELIDSLKAEMDTLKPSVDRYFEVSRQHGKLVEERRKDDERKKRMKAIWDASYEAPEYPSMGVAGSNGSATFKTEEQAKELVQLLVWGGSYTYGYELKWDGPGDYVVEPDYKYDHDRDVIYTAKFRKKREDEYE